jgi:hypothetical protein
MQPAVIAFIGRMTGQWFTYLLIRAIAVLIPSSPRVLRRGIMADVKRQRSREQN